MNSNCYQNRTIDKRYKEQMQPIFAPKTAPTYDAVCDIIHSFCRCYDIKYTEHDKTYDEREGTEFVFDKVETEE